MGLEMAQQLPSETVKLISERLAVEEGLRLPGQLTREGAEPPSAAKRAQYLQALLLRDPGVFLERHGEMLTAEERSAFEPLRGDYEVDFYLKLLEDAAGAHKQDATAKNRRLAYMNRLLQQGDFFSDEAMRERQPYLHHIYVGQFRPPGEGAPPAPGPGPGPSSAAAGAAEDGSSGGGGEIGAGARRMPLSQSILRHQDELTARLAARAEQQRYNMVEEETDSDEEEAAGEGRQGPGRGGGPSGGGGTGAGAGPPGDAGGGGEAGEGEEDGPGYVCISEAERQDNAEVFLDLMKEKFLRGEEATVDYKAIDADRCLDEDWSREAGQDAEDKYFSGE